MRRAADCICVLLALSSGGATAEEAACTRPLYLTFDTGHMGVAPLVADVLERQHVRATFFLADEKTLTGGTSLDDQWAAWWKARAEQGNAFGSHTFEHAYWVADAGPAKFRIRPSAGPHAGETETWTAQQYCESLRRSARRFESMTGQPMLPLFRAPGGKASPALLAAARQCGWLHVGWSPAGFLGDELPSDRFPNDALLARALREIRGGDVLLAHLGIWSRQQAWAPGVLEPLIVGLKSRGFCFRTLRDHPQYRTWLAAH